MLGSQTEDVVAPAGDSAVRPLELYLRQSTFGSGDRVFEFETSVDGIPRTSGILVDISEIAKSDAGDGLSRLATAFPSPRHRNTAAYGKVAILTRGSVSVFQVAESGAQPCWCGNATAVALAHAALATDRCDLLRLDVFREDKSHHVDGRLVGDQVEQQWSIADFRVHEFVWRDRRVVRVEGLNPYAIVEGPLPFGLSEHDVRTQLSGVALDAKLVVLERTASVPTVAFFNSNGRHGAAPQTGLASLAIAAQCLPWFRAITSLGIRYTTATGPRIEPLLNTRFVPGNTITVDMPVTAVTVRPYLGAFL